MMLINRSSAVPSAVVALSDRRRGAQAYEPLIYPNVTRPARSNIEVATLPVAGWRIEIEVFAAYPKEKKTWW